MRIFINDMRILARRLSPRDYPLNEYLTFEELEEWMADTVDDNSDKTELTELGETYEGKKIWGFHMGDKNHAGSKKKIFMGNFSTIIFLKLKYIILILRSQEQQSFILFQFDSEVHFLFFGLDVITQTTVGSYREIISI